MLSSSSSLWRCRHRWAVVLGQRGARAGGAIANARAGGALPPQPPPPGAEITSAVNPYIKHAVKLRESAKYRAQQRRLLLIGRPLLTELAAAQPGGLGALVLFVRPGAAPLPPAIAAARQISVNDAVMRKLTGGGRGAWASGLVAGSRAAAAAPTQSASALRQPLPPTR
jgi:hypothetical protein